MKTVSGLLFVCMWPARFISPYLSVRTLLVVWCCITSQNIDIITFHIFSPTSSCLAILATCPWNKSWGTLWRGPLWSQGGWWTDPRHHKETERLWCIKCRKIMYYVHLLVCMLILWNAFIQLHVFTGCTYFSPQCAWVKCAVGLAHPVPCDEPLRLAELNVLCTSIVAMLHFSDFRSRSQLYCLKGMKAISLRFAIDF